MYRVLKNKGHNMTITLENTETKASVIIGRLSSKIMTLLTLEGYTISSDTTPSTTNILITDKWELSVSESTATELSKLAMSMTKPVRKPKEKPAQSEQKITNNKKIDAMDVLLGLAQYN